MLLSKGLQWRSKYTPVKGLRHSGKKVLWADGIYIIDQRVCFPHSASQVIYDQY